MWKFKGEVLWKEICVGNSYSCHACRSACSYDDPESGISIEQVYVAIIQRHIDVYLIKLQIEYFSQVYRVVKDMFLL